MPAPEVDQHDDAALRAWDWRAALVEADRSPAWLARKTGAHYRAVYRYWHGQLEPTPAFLRSAAAVLGGPNGR